jgi:hypothetical protein
MAIIIKKQENGRTLVFAQSQNKIFGFSFSAKTSFADIMAWLNSRCCNVQTVPSVKNLAA